MAGLKITVTEFINVVYNFINTKPRTKDEIRIYFQKKLPDIPERDVKYCIGKMHAFSNIQNIGNKVFYIGDKIVALRYYSEITGRPIYKWEKWGAGFLDSSTKNFLLVFSKDEKIKSAFVLDRFWDMYKDIVNFTMAMKYDENFYPKINEYNNQLPESIKILRTKIKEFRKKLTALENDFVADRIFISEYEMRETEIKNKLHKMIKSYDNKIEGLNLPQGGHEKIGHAFNRRKVIILKFDKIDNFFFIYKSELKRFFNGEKSSIGVYSRIEEKNS